MDMGGGGGAGHTVHRCSTRPPRRLSLRFAVMETECYLGSPGVGKGT